MNGSQQWIGDEQAADFAARMSGGAVGAVAPAMRQPAMDDGMTHKCEGCEGGAPCSSCGGNISKNSPAYQALDWAFLATQHVQDSTWRAAMISDIVRSAPARVPSPEWRAIEGMTEGIEGSAAPRLTSGGFAQKPAWTGGDRREGPVYDVIPMKPVCCPEMHYPDDIKVHLPPVSIRGGAWELHWHVGSFLRYQEGGVVHRHGIQGWCRCKCCKFMQFHRGFEKSGTRTYEYKGEEDCFGAPPDPFDVSNSPTKVCFGMDNIPDALAYKGGHERSYESRFAGPSGIPIDNSTEAWSLPWVRMCVTEIYDTPGVRSVAVFPFEKRVCYSGVIIDVCTTKNGRHPIVARGSFELKVKGRFHGGDGRFIAMADNATGYDGQPKDTIPCPDVSK